LSLVKLGTSIVTNGAKQLCYF